LLEHAAETKAALSLQRGIFGGVGSKLQQLSAADQRKTSKTGGAARTSPFLSLRTSMGRDRPAPARKGQRHGALRGVDKGHLKRQAHGRRLASAASLASDRLGDWRHAVVEQQTQLDTRLAELVREVLADAPEQALPLAAAGQALQERVRAAGLRGDDGAIVGTSRYIKSRWGGWEGFVRSAAGDLKLSGETLRLASGPPPLPPVEEAPARRHGAHGVGLEPSALSALGLSCDARDEDEDL